MNTETLRLLALVQKANGHCTDYRAAQLLEVTSATVSKWRVGRSHMGPAAIVKACKLAGEPNVARWQIFIGAEREVGPDGDWYRDLRADMLKAEAGEKPAKDSSLSVLLRGARTRTAAAILAVIALLGLSGLSPENKAFAASSADSALRQECILW